LKDTIEDERTKWLDKMTSESYIRQRIKRTLNEGLDRMILGVLGVSKSTQNGVNTYSVDVGRARSWFSAIEQKAKEQLQNAAVAWLETDEAKQILQDVAISHTRSNMRSMVIQHADNYRRVISDRLNAALLKRIEEDSKKYTDTLIPESGMFFSHDEALATLKQLEEDIAKEMAADVNADMTRNTRVFR
jgi:hypothetical protein